MPWRDSNDLEKEFVESVKNYYSQNRPAVLERIKKFSDKNVFIFRSRKESDGFLKTLRENKNNK